MYVLTILFPLLIPEFNNKKMKSKNIFDQDFSGLLFNALLSETHNLITFTRAYRLMLSVLLSPQVCFALVPDQQFAMKVKR